MRSQCFALWMWWAAFLTSSSRFLRCFSAASFSRCALLPCQSRSILASHLGIAALGSLFTCIMGLWGPPLGIWATVATGQCCVGMADHVLSPPLTAEPRRDRARLIRY